MGGLEVLTPGGLIKAFRKSNIIKNYRFKEEAARRATSIDFLTRVEIGPARHFIRGKSAAHLRV